MTELNELESKMKAVMSNAKECVDLSLNMIKANKNAETVIVKHWENFVLHLFEYVKKKEKETGQEILKGISLTRFMKLL